MVMPKSVRECLRGYSLSFSPLNDTAGVNDPFLPPDYTAGASVTGVSVFFISQRERLMPDSRFFSWRERFTGTPAFLKGYREMSETTQSSRDVMLMLTSCETPAFLKGGR